MLGGTDGPPPGQGAFVQLWLTQPVPSCRSPEADTHLSNVQVAGCPQCPPPTKGTERVLTARWSPRPLQTRGPVRLGLLWTMQPSCPESYSMAMDLVVTVTLRQPCPQCDLFTFVREFTFHKTVSQALAVTQQPYEICTVILPSHKNRHREVKSPAQRCTQTAGGTIRA